MILCGKTYRTAIWGIQRHIDYLCNLPSGHRGYHYGEDEASNSYLNWPPETKKAPEALGVSEALDDYTG